MTYLLVRHHSTVSSPSWCVGFCNLNSLSPIVCESAGLVDAGDRIVRRGRVAAVAKTLKGQVIAAVATVQAVTGRGDAGLKLGVPFGLSGPVFKLAVSLDVAEHLGGVLKILPRVGRATLAGG